MHKNKRKINIFLVGLVIELRALHLNWCSVPATPQIHFALVTFVRGVLLTVCPGWPQTTILPISVFQISRIIGTLQINNFKVKLQMY
jgi:hypothetical protein